ncbi:MAG: RidA family protein [Pseudomonadota bacterium]
MGVRKTILSGSSFEEAIGYARAVVVDRDVFVSGTTGYDYSSMTISSDPAAQAEQCLQNITAALDEAGARLSDVVRVHYYFVDRSDFDVCAPIFKRHFGTVKPAATMLVTGLFDPAMKLEIEVSARLPADTNRAEP